MQSTAKGVVLVVLVFLALVVVFVAALRLLDALLPWWPERGSWEAALAVVLATATVIAYLVRRRERVP
jgi:hypothetical protein